MAWVLTQKKSLYKVVCNVLSAGVTCHALRRFSQILVQPCMSTLGLITCQFHCQAVHKSQDMKYFSLSTAPLVLIARKQLPWHLLKDFLTLLIICCTQIMSCFGKHGIFRIYEERNCFLVPYYFSQECTAQIQTECLFQQHPQCSVSPCSTLYST